MLKRLTKAGCLRDSLELVFKPFPSRRWTSSLINSLTWMSTREHLLLALSKTRKKCTKAWKLLNLLLKLSRTVLRTFIANGKSTNLRSTPLSTNSFTTTTVMANSNKMFPATSLECSVLDLETVLPADHQRSCLLDLPALDVLLNVKLLLRDSDLLPSALRSWCVTNKNPTPLLKCVFNKLLRRERRSLTKLFWDSLMLVLSSPTVLWMDGSLMDSLRLTLKSNCSEPLRLNPALSA